MVKFRFDYLYHTTSILTEDNRNALTDGGRIVYHAQMGEFPTSLDAPKSFTVSPFCDYHTRWTLKNDDGTVYETKEVFLKYKVLKEVDLFDNMGKYGDPSDQQLEGYDGFYGEADCFEVYLKNPSAILDPEFEMIEFCEECCTGKKCMELLDKFKI